MTTNRINDESLDSILDRQGVLVLDGGLATELEARGETLDDALWSARLLVERPQLIRDVHLEYLRAGADCVASASYQATREGFGRLGINADRADDLLRLSVALAIEARDEFWSDPANRAGRLRPLVAASVGPYGAYLADGSEYDGNYGLSVDELMEFHRPRLAVLASSGPDLLAFETIPAVREAIALAALLNEGDGPPAWLSFSCRDARHICDGSLLRDAIAGLEECPRLVAVGVNCTAPRFVANLLREASGVTGKPLVAYPNSGEGWDAASKQWLPGGQESTPAEGCATWMEEGAKVVGGCCRTRPSDIRALRTGLFGAPA